MQRKASFAVCVALLVACLARQQAAPRTASDAALLAAPVVTPPPHALVTRLHLSSLHTKYVDAGGLPVLGSRAVHDEALLEARYVVLRMIGHRPDVLRAIADRGIRVVVMAAGEMTTDVPEHADLTPAAYWNRRARGLGATLVRPATSCGEENLLELPGDPYATENILVHEFGHTVHELGVAAIDPTFDARLEHAYEHARQTGLWKGTYAMQNAHEYWAEATQSWFDTNRANDAQHGPVDTREKVVSYDPEVTALLREVYGDGPWRYTPPSRRAESERTHLAGFARTRAGTFAWPPSGPSEESVLPALRPGALPRVSPSSSTPATLVLFNRRKGDVAVDWVDFAGERKRYLVLRPGTSAMQATYAGHVWAFSEDGETLGGVVAPPGHARVDVE